MEWVKENWMVQEMTSSKYRYMTIFKYGQKYIKNLMVDAHSAFLIYPIKGF